MRVFKSFLYLVTGALLAPFSELRLDRWMQNARVLSWHLRGMPADEGLRGVNRKPQTGSNAQAEGEGT